jgi:cytochrome c peroxidase
MGGEQVKKIVAITVAALLVAGACLAETPAAKAPETKAPVFKYVGAAGCKACHSVAKMGGEEHKAWAASKHASAFATLATPAALEIAKKKNIADPQKADACLKCHVTGFGVAAGLKTATWKAEDGVTCEACHGPGSEYKAGPVMKALTAGTTKPETVGLLTATEKTCVKCHNAESPTYKEFKYAEMYAKIKHEKPKPAEAPKK